MTKTEEFLNSLSEDELKYLQEVAFDENGKIVSEKELDRLIAQEELERSRKDAVQYALKINLNSVYGVQIMPYFKFADEWQALGASTTLTGRILSKFGLIETVEQFFNPDRETRYEFPLLDNVIVAADDEEFFADPKKQMLRTAVISDTDSVTGDAILRTNLYGKISFDELIKKDEAREEIQGDKTFYHFDNLKVTNKIGDEVVMDDVLFVYSHETEKEIFEIELEDGKTIKVTEDHSIMVLDKNGELVEKKPFELTDEDVCIVELEEEL